jgi:hypothetical protein
MKVEDSSRWDGMPKKAELTEKQRNNRFFSWKAVPINILYKLQEKDFAELIKQYSSIESIAKALNMSKRIFIKYAKIYAYTSSETYYDYFQRMKSWKPKPASIYNAKVRQKVMEIVANKRQNTFPIGDLMYMLFRYELKKECCENCGCGERRSHDGRKPLLMTFKRKNNIKNYSLDNLQILCYNCYFMTVGDVSREFGYAKNTKSKSPYRTLEIDATSDINWQFDYVVYSDKSEAIPEEQIISRKNILKKFDKNLE